MLTVCSAIQELATPFTLMRQDTINYRLKIQEMQRKFERLEAKYITTKEQQRDIEYQFDKLNKATIIAKRDLREEELTYEALLVAVQMESAKLNTRAKAFRRVSLASPQNCCFRPTAPCKLTSPLTV